MDNNKIGRNIASLRKTKKLTQQQLGDKLFITDKAVSKWERGISFPDISMLIPISKVLEISLYDLLTGGEDDEQK